MTLQEKFDGFIKKNELIKEFEADLKQLKTDTTDYGNNELPIHIAEQVLEKKTRITGIEKTIVKLKEEASGLESNIIEDLIVIGADGVRIVSENVDYLLKLSSGRIHTSLGQLPAKRQLIVTKL